MAKRIGIADATTTKVTGRPPILVLIAGATGVGKTHLSVAIAGNRIKDFKPIYYGFLPNILEILF